MSFSDVFANMLEGFRGLFTPQPRSGDFNCARVYRGSYIVGSNQYADMVSHWFKVIQGDADIRRGKSVRVTDEQSTTDLETFYIYPKSPYVRLEVQGPGKRKILTLFKVEAGGKSRMFKQRITADFFRIVEPETSSGSPGQNHQR